VAGTPVNKFKETQQNVLQYMVLVPYQCKSGKYIAGPWAGMKPGGEGGTHGAYMRRGENLVLNGESNTLM